MPPDFFALIIFLIGSGIYAFVISDLNPICGSRPAGLTKHAPSRFTLYLLNKDLLNFFLD
jgi:hypothetical protein